MKLQLTLLVGAACALASAVRAQTVNDQLTNSGSVDLGGQARSDINQNQRSGVRLRDIPNIPNIGELFRDKSAPQRDENPLFGPQFPPAPNLDQTRAAGTRIRALKAAQGEILQIEIVRQSLGEVLRKVTAVMGVRAVIDPNLDKERLVTRVVRGRSWDELLAALSQSVEMVKSPAGTYFFAVKPNLQDSVTFLQLPDGTYRRFDGLPSLRELPPRPPAQRGPFAFGPSVNPELDPEFVRPKDGLPMPPLPNWQKREFNGREFYFVPAPVQ